MCSFFNSTDCTAASGIRHFLKPHNVRFASRRQHLAASYLDATSAATVAAAADAVLLLLSLLLLLLPPSQSAKQNEEKKFQKWQFVSFFLCIVFAWLVRRRSLSASCFHCDYLKAAVQLFPLFPSCTAVPLSSRRTALTRRLCLSNVLAHLVKQLLLAMQTNNAYIVCNCNSNCNCLSSSPHPSSSRLPRQPLPAADLLQWFSKLIKILYYRLRNLDDLTPQVCRPVFSPPSTSPLRGSAMWQQPRRSATPKNITTQACPEPAFRSLHCAFEASESYTLLYAKNV